MPVMGIHKRFESGFSAVEAFIIIVILALLGFGGWYVFHKQKSDTGNTSGTNAAAKDVNIQSLVSDIKQSVAHTYTTVSQEDTSKDYAWAIDYSAAGHAFKVRATADAHVMFTDKASWPIDYRAKPIPLGVEQSVVSTIKSKGGVEVTNPPINTTAMFGSAIEAKYYHFKNAVCLTTKDKKSVTTLTLGCANLSSFADVAKLADPFDSYIAQANNVKANDLILAAPVIHAGAAAGTEYATGVFFTPQLGATAYLYHKTDEGAGWHYYSASQEGLSCTELMKNVDAYAALKDVCHDSGP
jgi:hypothetical protein